MKKQPKIIMPGSVLETFLNTVSVLIFFVMLVYLFVQYSTLPDQVPGHYNAAGEADRWGGKSELFLLPIIGAALWVGMTVFEKYPHIYNYMNLKEENTVAQYKNAQLMINALKNEIVILFSFISVQTVRVASGAEDGLGIVFMSIFLVVVLGTVLYFMWRMWRN